MAACQAIQKPEVIQTIIPGSKSQESGQPGEADHSLPIDRMTARLPYVSFNLEPKHLKRGLTWAQMGELLASQTMEHHDADALAWLQTHMVGRWRFVSFVRHLPVTALTPPDSPVVHVGVELHFDHTGDAVMFKLTWGNERF